MKFYLYILVLLGFISSCSSDRKSLDDLTQEEDKEIESVSAPIEIDSMIFIMENSVSMKGYIDCKQSTLRSIFFELTTGFSSAEKTYYVANQVVSENSKLPNLIENYNKIKDEKSNKSNHEVILKHSIKSVSESNCVVLFTDGIYSMDGNGLDYVSSHIKKAYSEALSKNEVEVLIYKFIVPFSGKYYCESPECKSKKYFYKGKRPIYMFVFGKPEIIKRFQDEPDQKRVVKDFSPTFTRFFLTKENNSEYKVLKPGLLRKYVSGSYGTGGRSGRKEKTISEADKNGKESFQFAFAVDFSDIGLNNDYIENKSNYEISKGNFTIDNIISLNDIDESKADRIRKYLKSDAYTHFIIASSIEGMDYFGNLKIGLKNIPNILSDDVENDCIKKELDSLNTITFSHLVDGIRKSYENINDEKLLAVLNFTINP